MKEIHLCCWAQQPDIQIECDQSWTTPAWGSKEETDTGIKGVYLADNGMLYTFDYKKVTCEKCK